jgi:hypothetical protein
LALSSLTAADCHRRTLPQPTKEASVALHVSHDAATPTELDAGILDSATPFDRAAFCADMAAESKKALQSMSARAVEADIEPDVVRRTYASAKPPFGSCVGSPKGAWAIALERLGAERDMVTGSWSLVHGLANGTDARFRPFALGKGRDNFGLHRQWIVFNCPHVLATFDWDGDGDEEVAVSVVSSGHETSESQSAVFSFKDGVVALYPPAKGLDIDKVEDVDGDGRPDIVTSGPYSEGVADMGAGFSQVRLASKLFVAHSRADGTFSFSDEIGKRAVQKWCPKAERLVFRTDEDAAAPLDDEEKTRARHVQSVLCARIRGRSAASLAAEIRRECPTEAETKASEAGAKELAAAEERRTPYCWDRDLLLRWVARSPPLELR